MAYNFEGSYKGEGGYFGLKPDKEIISILKYIKNGYVLDLGVGEGRNALFLAKKGFNVTGIDLSKTGINHFLKSSKAINVKVKAIIKDIIKFRFNKDYDIIISSSTLHFLNEKHVYKIIKNMKAHTNKGGINFIKVFTVKNPAKNFPYLFKKNELKKIYKDWKILQYKEHLTPFEKHGESGMLHKHAIASIIARKI